MSDGIARSRTKTITLPPFGSMCPRPVLRIRRDPYWPNTFIVSMRHLDVEAGLVHEASQLAHWSPDLYRESLLATLRPIVYQLSKQWERHWLSKGWL